MKKAVSIILALALALCLAACGGGADEATTEPPENPVFAEAEEFLAAYDETVAKTNESFDSFETLFAKAEELRAAADGLSAEEKEAHAEELDALIAASDFLRSVREHAVECAAVYVDAFLSLDGNSDAVITKIGCICQLRAGTEGPEPYYMFALTCGGADGERSVYATARYGSVSAGGAIKGNTEMFFSDTPLNASNNALAAGNIVIDPEEVTEE